MTTDTTPTKPEPPQRQERLGAHRNGIASALEKPCFHQRVERPKKGKGSYRRPKPPTPDPD